MKYVITENTVTVVLKDGQTFTCESSYPFFEDIKTAIANKEDEDEIKYLFNKIMVDEAKELLKKTCGKIPGKKVV